MFSLCGGSLGGPDAEGFPIIFWRGYGGDILFHAACGADFTFRLGQDVQALKHKASIHIVFEAD